MAVKVINRTWIEKLNDYQYEYICDTEADVADLPPCATSSTALVIETGGVFIVNTNCDWVPFGG